MTRTTKTLAAIATAILGLSATAPAGDIDWRIDFNIGIGDHRPMKRVWVEPVYETRCEQVWVEPVYEMRCQRVWIEPVFETRCEQIWVPDRYEYRQVRYVDPCGRVIVRTEAVLVERGHYQAVQRQVCVREGHWEDIPQQVCVREGFWQTVERQVCVREGHWIEVPAYDDDCGTGGRTRIDIGGRYDRGERPDFDRDRRPEPRPGDRYDRDDRGSMRSDERERDRADAYRRGEQGGEHSRDRARSEDDRRPTTSRGRR